MILPHGTFSSTVTWSARCLTSVCRDSAREFVWSYVHQLTGKSKCLRNVKYFTWKMQAGTSSNTSIMIYSEMLFFRVVKFQSVGRHPRPLHSVNLPLHQMYGVMELSCGKWCRLESGHTGTWAIKMYVVVMFDILMWLHFVLHQILLSIESEIQ